MNRRVVAAIAGVGVFALAACGAAWTQRERFERSWWTWQAQRPLGDAELREIADCAGLLTWNTAIRVVIQDVDTPCGDDHVVGSLATKLEKHRLRTRWVTDTLGLPDTTPDARLRIAAALMDLSVDEPEIPWAGGDPRLSAARAAWWRARLADAGDPPAWADPGLQLQLSLHRLREDLDRDAEDARRLLWAVAHGPREPLDTDALALRVAGLDLPEIRARLASRRPLHDMPLAWVPALTRRIGACDPPGSTACLELLLDLIESAPPPDAARTDAAPGADRAPAPPAASALDALWSVQYGGDPRRVAAAADELGAWLAWAAERPGPDTILRLTTGPAPDAPPGDPIEVLRRRGGSPWASAWAALLLGARLDVPVEVGEQDGWVDLRVGDRRLQLASCGTREPPLDDAGAPAALTPWPPAAVAARATLEAAQAAAGAGDRSRAVRLAALAERLDPALAGARGRVLQLAPGAAGSPAGTAAGDLGRSAGARVRWPATEAPPAAPPRGLPGPPPACDAPLE